MRRVVVVENPTLHVETILGSLGAAGFEAAAVANAEQARAQIESGAVGVIMVVDSEDRGGRILGAVPPSVRRGCLLLLVVGREASTSGIEAFLNDADLVIGSNECARIGEIVAAALSSKKTLVAALDPGAAARLGG